MPMNRFYRVIHALATPIVHLLFPFRAVGLENLPEGGVLLCGNHANAVDPVLIALAMPGTTDLAIMGKDQLFHIPVLGWALRKLGVFPVRRGENDLAAMKTAMKALSDGKRLMVFPEGTRVDYPGQVEAKGGVVVMATRTGTPLVPVYCGGKRKFFRRTSVVFGEPYVPEIAGRRPTQEENQAAAAEILRRAYALGEVDAWK